VRHDLGLVYLRLGQAADDPATAYEWSRRSHQLIQELQTGNLYFAPYNAELADSFGQLGRCYRRLGKWKEADEHYQSAVRLWQGLNQAEPHNAQTQRALANNYIDVAQLRLESGDAARARDLLAEALKVLKFHQALDTQNLRLQRQLASAFEQIGNLHMCLGAAEAKEYLEEAVRLRDKVLTGDPASRLLQAELALACHRVGEFHLRRQQFPEALPCYERAADL